MLRVFPCNLLLDGKYAKHLSFPHITEKQHFTVIKETFLQISFQTRLAFRP